MFTAGCCILCLSIRKWCADAFKEQMFNLIVRRAARNMH